MRRIRGITTALLLVWLAACAADTAPRDATETAVSTTPGTDTSNTNSSNPVPSPSTDPDPPDGVPTSQDPTVGSATDSSATEPAREPALGTGDELFADLGSSDVDVVSYDVRIDVRDRRLDATVDIIAMVDPAVDVMPLDQLGLDIETVEVEGEPATFEVSDPELLIDLPDERPDTVDVSITYGVVPEQGRSDADLPVGWIPVDDQSYVLNEPDGARMWMPANDHPSDKATWRFSITAPDGVAGVANGEMEQRGDGTTPWVWIQDEEMSTYLVQMIIGDYDVIDGSPVVSSDGTPIPLTHVVPTGERERFDAAFGSIDEQVAFFEERFGPYPLDRYGLAFVADLSSLAMETQGRSMFGARDFDSGELGFFENLLLAHELAHQWFGDAVSPQDWSDIWLNESFASYAHWLWLDEIDLQPLDGYADAMLSQRQNSNGSTGEPRLDDMFGFNRYDGGAVVVHALRLTMGDDAFFELLTTWVADNTGTSRSTEAFIQLASDIHGDDLVEFFETWLYAEALPDSYPGGS